MAILDAGPFQAWIAAFDKWDRAKRRVEVAGATGHRALIDYLEGQESQAAAELNAALRELKRS